MKVLKKLNKVFEKNKAEGLALVTGKMPNFVYGVKQFTDIPVFCFHSAQYPLFEKQLQFLNENGYRTLTADELYERRSDKNYRNTGKEIVITFDDGMASVWTVAYPLLKKYEHKIISFILPGLMQDGTGVGDTIDDVESEQEKIDLADRDFHDEPLCNWHEVEAMNDSGLIDFQSHGMNHTLISISSKIIDFIHPDYDAYHYGNIHVPMYRDPQGNDTRNRVLGHPVYQHAPRLSGKPRFFDPVELRTACADFVAQGKGQGHFFSQSDWHRQLQRFVADFQANNSEKFNDYETLDQVQAAVEFELVESKRCIEEKLNNKVAHFCFPWFIGAGLSAEMLKSVGYQSAHMGATNGFSQDAGVNYPLFVNRLQEEYLLALPGSNSRSSLQVLAGKMSK